MPAAAAVAGAALVAGGTYLASENAKDAANTQANAMRGLSEQQYQRAQEAAKKYPEFRPVTVTSMFGTPQYTYDDTGRLTGVSSQAAPWLASLQGQGQGLAGQYMNLQQQALQNQYGQQASNQAFGAAQGLYGRAEQAMPTSYDTTQATQDYYAQMQGLAAADRERLLASTRNNLFQRGRQGLAMGATQAGGELATNPEMAAYYNAIAKQDASLALDAKSKAMADLQNQQNLGLGLFTAGGQQTAVGSNALQQYYGNISASQSPFATNMAQLTGMEQSQYAPVTQGMQYGTNVTNQANTMGNAYMQASGAGYSAALQGINAEAAGNAINPWAGAMMGAGKSIGGTNWSNLFSGGSGGTGWATTGRSAATGNNPAMNEAI